MSTLEATLEQVEREPRLLGGAVPATWTIERIYDPKVMTELLYRSKELSDEAFIDLVDDVGVRAARIVLRAKACSGDVKACELYLKLAQQAKADKKRPALAAERNVTTSAGMVVPARPASD